MSDLIVPRQIVSIQLSSLPAYEAGAELFSYVAYPDPTEEIERQRCQIALSRWAITERAKVDKEWALTRHEMKPSLFIQPEKFFLKCYNNSLALLLRRGLCAMAMMVPYLGGKTELVDEELPPTVENISTRWIGEALGYSEGSLKTIEAKLWAPTKPVAHLAATLAMWKIALNFLQEPWEQDHKLFNQDWFLGTLSYSDILEFIIQFSEEMRIRMLQFETFKRVSEDETIKFEMC
jgi:hypothetical protein